MTDLLIDHEYCTSLEQLRGYFKEEIAYGSEVFLDLLDYGRHGDVGRWLREQGEEVLAEAVESIDPSVGDAEYIVRLGRAVTGGENANTGEDGLPVKPPFEECLHIEAVDTEKFGDSTTVKVSIKVVKTLNEQYSVELLTDRGSNKKSINPSEHRLSEVIPWEITFRSCSGSSLGEVRLLADGKPVVLPASSAASAPQPSQKPEPFTVGDVDFKMVRVEAGTFTMGATPEQGDDAYGDEKPPHSVTLTKAYYIGQTPVTQALWQAVTGSNPSHFKGDNRPVEYVSWNDCQNFIRKLNEKLSGQLGGRCFRLPTEAEWEYAARGGRKSEGHKYSGSDTLSDVAWYYDNRDSETHDVAKKKANELGLFDMSGNVREWCSDYWKDNYNGASLTDPQGPNSGSYRVSRGGGWYYVARRCRVSYRDYYTPGNAYDNFGFRLVLSE